MFLQLKNSNGELTRLGLFALVTVSAMFFLVLLVLIVAILALVLGVD